MKQKIKRLMAGLLALLTIFSTISNSAMQALAASPQANIKLWYATPGEPGEIVELKKGYYQIELLYHWIDGHSAYCLNYSLGIHGGQLMTSYNEPVTELTSEQEELLHYTLYYGHDYTNGDAEPGKTEKNEFVATQALVWCIANNLFGTPECDSAALKLCNATYDPTYSYNYYQTLKSKVANAYYMQIPSFASGTVSGAATYELKWNETNKRYQVTLTDDNNLLDSYDVSLSGHNVEKSGNKLIISTTSVNSTGTMATFSNKTDAVEIKGNSVFWLTGDPDDQEMMSTKPVADPIKAYFNVKTEAIGYGEIIKQDEKTGKKLSGAVYGIYSDSDCTKKVDTLTTGSDGKDKSKGLIAGTYYVKEITAPKGYVKSDKIHTLIVKAGQTTTFTVKDKEQLGSITIYKEGEVLSGWNGSNFNYTKKKLPGATFKVTAGADIYKADGTKVYKKGAVVAEKLVSGSDGKVLLTDLHLGTYVITETKSIDGYTINTTPKIVKLQYESQTVSVQTESATILNARQKAKVTVAKKDGDTNKPLDGGKYTLYAGNDIKNNSGKVIVKKGAALQTVTTGENGKASYTVDLPIGNSYYIKETKAPKGYVRKSDDVYSFSFKSLAETNATASFSHTFKNDRATAKIHLDKVDKELDGSSSKKITQGDATLEGAVYGLYARKDIIHPDGATGVMYKAGDLVAKMTTDANGDAEVDNLYLGSYYVKEITAPKGYVLDMEEHDVVCEYKNDLTAEVTESVKSKEDVIKQPFQLIKISDTGEETEASLLAGAGFTAYLKSSLPVKSDGSYNFKKATPVVLGENGETEIFTDKKGHAQSIAIPYGTYVVVESTTPHNMETIKPFEVKISKNNPTKPQTWRVCHFSDRSDSLSVWSRCL